MEEKIFDGLEYLLSYPKGFCEKQKYPLLIFLHGRGARSKTIEKLKGYGCIHHLLHQQEKSGYILLAPHCKSGTWSEWMYTLIRLIDNFRECPFVDKTRLYLTGNSMGGYGTWNLSILRASWFASAMPICGGGLPGMANELGKLPIRTFHGLCDKTVDPIESLQMAKAVNSSGGHAELILFPELAHNCWDAVYTDEKNFDWMLSFTNERENDLSKQLSVD